MLKPLLAATLLLAAPALAQAPAAMNPGAVCPAGTGYAAIRHDTIKPGQWAAFEAAVAAHNAWYASHDNQSKTVLLRVVARGAAGASLSADEAVTITSYANTPQPAHDAGWDAFTAQYRAASETKDEARVCVPAMR